MVNNDNHMEISPDLISNHPLIQILRLSLNVSFTSIVLHQPLRYGRKLTCS